MLYCDTCGKKYPDNYSTTGCRICGGLLDTVPVHNAAYRITTAWDIWLSTMLYAPRILCSEDYWLRSCQVFNGCALCGDTHITNKLLLIEAAFGGKYYAYNVLPSCDRCLGILNNSRKRNFYLLHDAAVFNQTKVKHALGYLYSIMVDATYSVFDYEHDAISIIATITEDTSIQPFNGIFARRVYDNTCRVYDIYNYVDGKSDTDSIHWRLLSE